MSDFCVLQDTVNRIRGEDLFKFNWQISGQHLPILEPHQN